MDSNSMFTYDQISCIIQPNHGKGGLFLGDIYAATDSKLIDRLKIKAVISIMSFQQFTYDLSVQHKFIQVDDHEQADISRYFMEVIEFVNQNRITTNVLIHCYAGISRSATLVIGYLMSQCHMSFEQAFKYVQSKRSIVSPNLGFLYQLKRLENSIYINQYFSPREQPPLRKISSPSQHQREKAFANKKTLSHMRSQNTSPVSAYYKII